MIGYLLKQNEKIISFLKGVRVIKKLAVPKGEVVFSCGGIGDSLYVGLFIDEYFSTGKMERLTLYIQENHKDIIELCNITKTSVLYYKKEDRKALYYYLLVRNRLNSNYKYRLLQPRALNKRYEKLAEDNSIEEIYKKYIFTLNSDFLPFKQLHIKNKKGNIDIKKNSVFVIQCSNSIPSLKKEFWISLVNYLAQKYNVYVNSMEGLEASGKQLIDLSALSLADLFEIAPSFDYIISVRNGLCDLLAKQVCNLIVLYPYSRTKNFYQMFAMNRILHTANLIELQDAPHQDEYLLTQIQAII